jgi:hypothetical protein
VHLPAADPVQPQGSEALLFAVDKAIWIEIYSDTHLNYGQPEENVPLAKDICAEFDESVQP